MKKTTNTSEDVEEEKDVDETVDEEEAEEEKTATPGKSVSFKIRNPNVKEGFSITTYSEAEHGKDFKALAQQFQESNTHVKITSSMTEEEVKAAQTFNNGIKHQILASKSE